MLVDAKFITFGLAINLIKTRSPILVAVVISPQIPVVAVRVLPAAFQQLALLVVATVAPSTQQSYDGYGATKNSNETPAVGGIYIAQRF